MNDWMRLLNLQEEVRQKDAEIERLKALLAQAADELIDELRKAAK